MTINNSKQYNPSDISKWFVNRVDRDAGDDITPLKLQKLLYYAQAWWLANNNELLFNEKMQAWTHGPMVPSIWKEYASHGWQSILPFEDFTFPNSTIESFFNKVYEVYGKFEAKALEDLTHSEEPWQRTRGNLPLEAKCTSPMDEEFIRDYYAKRISKSWAPS